MRNILMIFLGLIAVAQSAGVNRYVSTSGTHDAAGGFTNWVGAANNIQAAVTKAGVGDTVWVTNGVYHLSDEISVTKGITLRSLSGKPDDTLLVGGYPAVTNRILTLNHAAAIVEGFTLTNGAATNAWGSVVGSGAKISAGTLRGCTVIGCGSLVTNKWGGNAGGGVHAAGVNSLVTECRIEKNTALSDGGGVYLGSGAQIRNSQVLCNTVLPGNGGGITVTTGCLAENCVIVSNRAPTGTGGGVNLQNGGARLVNSLVFGNSAKTGSGGGVAANANTTAFNEIVNCTVAGNSPNGISVSFHTGKALSCQNSIIYGNTLKNIAISVTTPNSGPKTYFEYTCMRGVNNLPGTEFTLGDGNLDADPLFVDLEGGNVRLKPDAPCRDAGTNQLWMVGAKDLDKKNRIHEASARVDMGCYESAPLGTLMALRGCLEPGTNSAGLYVGTAKVDITPPEEDAVDLVGKKLTINDSIYARVVVLKNGETSLAIVSLDLILFASAKVVSEAKTRWGVDHVVLNSTHTHSSMAPKGLIIGGGQPDWTRHDGDPREFVHWPALSQGPWYAATEEKINAAIGEASTNLFSARIAAERRPFVSPYMAHNRRLVDSEGNVTMLWSNPSHIPTEPLDPTISVIRVDDETGRTRVVLVHYACHAVTLMNAGVLSRDFPGTMVDYVEEQFGDDCMAMFLQGAAGDIDPYEISLRDEHGLDIVRLAGESLGTAAVSLANDMTMPQNSEASLRIVEDMVEIPYRKGNSRTDACVTTVVIDQKFALATIPGEPFIQHQLNLSERFPTIPTLMLGYSYSGRGCPFLVYVPTAQAVTEGGYGATECSFVSADAGDRMVDAVTAAIGELTN